MMGHKKFQYLAVAIGFSLWGLYLRTKLLAGRGWWVDEIAQFTEASGTLKPFWKRLSNGEMSCFPGDYLLTFPFIKAFGDNKWLTAIPHMVATAIGFYFLYLICLRYLKTVWATALAFLIYSANSELIYHSFELRPYAVLATFSLMVFYCTETIVCAEYNPSPIQKFFIGALFFLTILYQAYGIFIVGFCTLYSILNERSVTPWKSIIKRIAKLYIIVGVLSMPIWFWWASYNVENDFTHQTFDFIPNPMVDVKGFFKSVVGNLISPKPLRLLLAGPVLALLLPQPSRLKYIGFFLLLVVLPITLLLVFDLSRHYWFIQRQFIWVISLFAFFVAWGWESAVGFAMKRR